MKQTTVEPFQCDRCNYGCTKLTNILKHKMKHSALKPFLCDQCDFRCSKKTNIYEHKMMHTDEKLFHCDNKSIDGIDLLQCNVRCTDKTPFECDQCNYISSCNNSSLLHIMKHTGEKTLNCDQASYECNLNTDLLNHEMEHYSEKTSNCDFKTDCINTLNLYIMDDICDKSVKYDHKPNNSLIVHTRKHSKEIPYQRQQYGSQYIDKTVLLKNKNFSEKILNYYKCDFKSDCINTLNLHICDKSVTYDHKSNNSLNVHTRKHSGEIHNQYGSQFIDKMALFKKKTKNTSVKLFACSQCEYRSSHKSFVKLHIMKHTGDKPFKCGLCDYKCAQKTALVEHNMKHTGEKPFRCSECGYRSTRKGALVQHRMKHTGLKPFACDECNYKCTQKADLLKHKVKHTGQKPFRCNQCDYRATFKNCLTVHLRTHNNN